MSPRWTPEKAQDWYRQVPWLVGSNFTPSTAGNQLELWQSETFDAETIDRELGWAASVGMNSVRVFLHNLLWSSEGDVFLDRVEQFLALAEGHGISMMPVLFDGVWNPEPALGPQPDPVLGVHNSIWVQGPGSAMLFDQSTWPELERYVHAVLSRFGDDSRICLWDLFNEPAQRDIEHWKGERWEKKAAAAIALTRQVFAWAQSADPTQPLTVGVYGDLADPNAREVNINAVALELSDVVTFHNYEPGDGLRAMIAQLQKHGRPLVCTEWLARGEGSTADLIQDFGANDVGAFIWGLVDGRTQTRYPWSSWVNPVEPDEVWHHELFHPDGTPYDEDEVSLFRDAVTSFRHE